MASKKTDGDGIRIGFLCQFHMGRTAARRGKTRGRHWRERELDLCRLPERNQALKFEIERVSDKEIQAVVTPNGLAQLAQVHVFDRQWNQIETLKGGNRIVQYSPHLPAFSFPLQVGKTWAQNYDWQKMDVGSEGPRAKNWAESQERRPAEPRNHGSTRAEGKVLGWEDITVAAGAFTALKIELKSPHYAGLETRRIFGKAGQFGGVLETYWCAPEVKRFVKYESKLYVGQQLKGSAGLELLDHGVTPKAAPPGPLR